jgi:AcrR family transcriptional regulator
LSLIKERIIESAVQHFSVKGYTATSIQDISDDCEISKGSLYKYFQSKEELFKEVYLRRQQNLSDQLESISADTKLTPREVFIQETAVQFEFYMVNKFIMQEARELFKADHQLTSFSLRLRSSLLNYNKESLIRLLGEELIPNIWDMVVVYNGMIREFIHLGIFEEKPLMIRDITVFIADRIEEMAANIIEKKPVPILDESLMGESVRCGMEGKTISAEEQRNNLLASMLSTVKELSVTKARRTQLQEAVETLEEEFGQEHPKAIIVLALLGFLQQEHELKSLVWQLDKHLMKVRKD